MRRGDVFKSFGMVTDPPPRTTRYTRTRRVFMKKIKAVGDFVIFELNKREQEEYGFAYAPVLKESVEAATKVCPTVSSTICA